MKGFNLERNEYTGEMELVGLTTLASPISSNRMTNSNGKGYYLCSVSFENAQGDTVTRSAKIWEGNLNRANEGDGMIPGEKYLTRVQQDGEGRIWITISHLQSANLATTADFAGAFSDVKNVQLPVGQAF